MFNSKSNELFATDLAKYIVSRVTGSHERDEIIDKKPSRTYLIGTLASRRIMDNDSKLTDTDEEKAASMRASRMSVGILVNNERLKNPHEITVDASGYVFYPTKKKDVTNKMVEIESENDENSVKEDKSTDWKRLTYSNKLKVDITREDSYYLDFSHVINEVNKDSLTAKKISEKLWIAKVQLSLKKYDDIHTLITFNYENETLEPKNQGSIETTLFNCNLEISLNGLKTEKFVNEYPYEGYYQKYFYDLRTLNCQAELDESHDRIHTKHIGEFAQSNIRPRIKIPGLDLSFKNLMYSESAVNSLEDFISEMKKYEIIYESNLQANDSSEEYQPRIRNRQQTWEERESLVGHFKKLVVRVKEGVELIKNDSLVLECFLRTNETFYNNYLHLSVPSPNAGWRLFQLAFLLSTIKSIVKEERLDEADVLHVDTGGGKSEAYFALITFTVFYERACGKENGVSAIVKFPLRMLSIQQLERISSVIIHAENVRKKYESKYNGEPFSLGYYVGSKDRTFPQYYKINRQRIYEDNDNKLLSPPPESPIILQCPLCSSTSKGTIRLEDDHEHRRLLHKCEKCSSVFYIYLSDREIYRWQPSVIVSTVDKWAGLATQRRARNLLGGRGSFCPHGHGFIPSGDKCEEDKSECFKCTEVGNNFSGSTGPRLSIQDEMHLLSEGFGTIAAHFEGLIDEFVKETSGRPLKHISMSATLNGTGKQIRELYNKNKYFVIPGRCPEGIGSINDFFFERLEGHKRIIFGMKPNLRDNHYASLISLLHYGEFIVDAQSELNNHPSEFCKKYNLSNVSDAQDLLTKYISPLTYHVKKQDAYEMSRLDETVIGDALTFTHKSDMKGQTLTGDDDLNTLKMIINAVHKAVESYNSTFVDNNCLIFRPVYATSVVSHGVDLEEWNFMIFQGLPYSTSEYIQALSRVGRKYLGIVLLWFYPNRIRDSSFYRNFDRYHDSLDHEVRPVPLNRYAKLGMYQTVNSLFCAGIINYLSNKKGMLMIYKKDIEKITQDDKKSLINFITSIYGKNALDIDVSKEVEDRITYLTHIKGGDKDFFPNILNNSERPYFFNQTGMRGIQRNLILTIKPKEESLLEKMGGIR